MRWRHGVFCAVMAALAALSAGCQPDPLEYHSLDMSRSSNGDVRLPGGQPQPGPSAWNVSTSRAWKYIVIHHSASDTGNAATFDQMHRAKGWDGLGYHFVIDNGQGGTDGRVEVGYRWQQQKQGAHTGRTPDNEYNEAGIGICLVGDFTHRRPTARQLESLNNLVRFLCQRYGITSNHVIGHRDAPNAKTECPGDMLYDYVYQQLRPSLTAGR